MCRRKSSGFTLVELLVVIAIIGMLVALLLPAVQAAREAGRRTQCTNQMKEIALACLHHDQAQGFLPTGGWGPQWAGDPDQGYSPNQPGGWLFNILPYMDQQALHDLGLNANNTGRTTTQATQPPVFLCPTRSRVTIAGINGGNGFPYNNPSPLSPPFYNTLMSPGPTQPIGRTDYAANGGGICNSCLTSSTTTYPSTLQMGQLSWNAQTWHNNNYDADGYATATSGVSKASSNGAMYVRSRVQMSQISDGPSKTYLFGERYINPDYYNTLATAGTGCGDNGGWDMGSDFNNTRWVALLTYYDPSGSYNGTGTFTARTGAATGTTITLNGYPTARTLPVLQDVSGYGTCGSTSVPGGESVLTLQDPPVSPPNYNSAATPSCDTNFGSAHPVSFNMAFCDGSVHPILYSINIMTHIYLGQRADHAVVDAAAWQ